MHRGRLTSKGCTRCSSGRADHCRLRACEQFYVVTTNWDRATDARVVAQFPTLQDHILHVHGDHAESSEFLLPSEVAFEGYYSPEVSSVALNRHRRILDAVDWADQVVIYGLSLSPLDAELSSLLSVGIDESGGDKTVDIVDPESVTVAAQLRCVLQKKKPTIRCWIPPMPA